MKAYEKAIRKGCPEHKQVKEILKRLGIYHRIHWSHERGGIMGIAIPPNEIIIYTKKVVDVAEGRNGYTYFVKKRISKQEFLCTFVHELQHLIMFKNGEYLTYHRGLRCDKAKYSEFLRWAKEYLVAERKADRMAKQMMKKCLPRIPYIGYYDGKRGADMVKRVILAVASDYYPKKIKDVKKKLGY